MNIKLMNKIKIWGIETDPTLEKLVDLCKEFYADGNEAGGWLHLVLDDGNLEDDHIKFCLETANNYNDLVAFTLAEKLLKLSMVNRELLYKKLWD